ncbi:MAG: sugar porter family MFS transporter [Candidatus Omnitrophota bacterium]|nr:sugar porter family MFS transporter [Candidatus Omnitrophota bacterium]
MENNFAGTEERLAGEIKDVRKFKVLVYVVALTAALAGLLFGLDIGVISGALPFIAKQFNASTEAQEFVVSSLLAGAVLGTLISGLISRKYGRKNALLVSAVVFAIGALLSALSVSTKMLIMVRIFLGVAVGMASFTAPLYLSEMAPRRIRGALISMYQLMITIGILMAYMSDTFLSYGKHWRVMLGVLVIPSTFMFIGVLLLPKSPRWLVLAGKKERARKVLNKLRHIDEVEGELVEIENTLENKQSGFQLLVENKQFRKVLLLGIGLQAVQQFTGMNVIMYYAPKIFKLAGFTTTSQAMWGTVLVGLINVLATFIAIAFVDRLGRKPILFTGFVVMGLSMGTLGLMFNIGIKVSQTVQFAAIGALLVFIVGFAMSAGPIIWVICSEIYPLAGRDLGITTSTATNWVCNTIVGATFLTLLNVMGPAHTFWLYGGLNLLFILFLFLFVPETKGVSLEKIERNLLSGKRLVRIGR